MKNKHVAAGLTVAGTALIVGSITALSVVAGVAALGLALALIGLFVIDTGETE